jgi:hypothetical protein
MEEVRMLAQTGRYDDLLEVARTRLSLSLGGKHRPYRGDPEQHLHL